MRTNEAKKTKEAESEELLLLEKAQAGDVESMEQMIIKYKSLVRSIARAKFFLASGGDGEDLVQEGTIGFLKAVREYRSDKGKGSFASFAALCIKSKITDAMRTYSRDKHKPLNTASNLLAGNNEEEYLIDKVVAASDPVSNYIDEEEKLQFYRKMDSLLSPKQSKILKLYLEGYSYKEIADKLKIKPKTVDNGLKAAKEKIKKSETVFSAE